MWLVFALVGCDPGGGDPSQTSAVMARTDRLVLQVTDVERGGLVGFRLQGAEPNAPVQIVSGEPGAGNCPAALGGACWGVVQPTPIAVGTTEDDGSAFFTVKGDRRARIGDVWGFQAWIDGATDEMSAVVQREVLARGAATPPAGGNVLIVVFDDLGTEKLAMYEGVDAPATPTLDALADEGVRFDNAYARPSCVPSRATILTGRFGRRHGVGMNWRPSDSWELGSEQITLAEIVDYTPYLRFSTSFVGKWHLGSRSGPSGLDHPKRQGWDYVAGSFENIEDYFRWRKLLDDGSEVDTTTYATTDTANEAIARIAAMPEPWLLVVSFNAPHAPLHAPPVDLVPTPSRGSYKATKDMIAAADTELGRILASMTADVRDRTHIFAISDNGSDGDELPMSVARRGKGTLFDPGVRIPLIAAGPSIGAPGTTSDAFVDAADLWATVAALAGVELDRIPPAANDDTTYRIDGMSLLPLLADPSAEWGRDRLVGELFGPPGPGPYPELNRQMVRTATHKLIVDHVSGKEMFFEYSDGDEGEDRIPCGLTPEQEEVRATMRARIDEHNATTTYDAVPPEVSDTGWLAGYPLGRDTALPRCPP